MKFRNCFFKALLPLMAASAALFSCKPSGEPVKTEVFAFEDTTARVSVKVSAELPADEDGISIQISEILRHELDDRLSRVTSYEGERFFDPYKGDPGDQKACVKYYFDNLLALLGRLAQEDADERAAWLEEDAEMTPERKAEILSEMPGWEYEYSLTKIVDEPAYVVFQSQDYIYMGGAHGGVGGDGCLTFDKMNGHFVKVLIDPENAEAMQPLLTKGLTSYFADAGEQIAEGDLRGYLTLSDEDIIPLPAWQPYPTKDGLVFTYQQYEVAPYAAGMPSFVLPYAEVEPFLTEDAAKMLRR